MTFGAKPVSELQGFLNDLDLIAKSSPTPKPLIKRMLSPKMLPTLLTAAGFGSMAVASGIKGHRDRVNSRKQQQAALTTIWDDYGSSSKNESKFAEDLVSSVKDMLASKIPIEEEVVSIKSTVKQASESIEHDTVVTIDDEAELQVINNILNYL